MNGLAGASWAAVAMWVALLLTGLLTGALLARWNATEEPLPALLERLLLAAAAASVVAWFASAGSLLGNSTTNALVHARVPIETGPGYRLAVLWATLPGGGLTFAASLLIVATLSSGARAGGRSRLAALTSALALVGLAIAVWFTPAPDALPPPTTIPPFVQHPAAALAPMFAMVALVCLSLIGAMRGAGRVPAQSLILATWVAATLVIASEQLARSGLGIGPRDAITLGSASSGLILWLVTSALVHRGVQTVVLRRAVDGTITRHPGGAALAAHIGAAFVVTSFAAHAIAARSTVSLAPGSPVQLTDSFRRTWTLANQGVSRFDAEGVDVLSLAVEARDPRGNTRLVTPAVHEHHGPDGRHLDNAVSRRASADGLLQGMRILLLDADSLDVASVRVTFMPVPFLWPAGVALLLLSAALSVPGDHRAIRHVE
jgi:hypothetical protein